MMLKMKKIVSIALATAIGTGAFAANAGSAMAAGSVPAPTVEVQFGPGGHLGDMRRDHSPRPEIREHRFRRDEPRRGHYPRHGYRKGFTPRVCTNGEAVAKVRSLGVRRAHVAWANHRAVKVNGRKFGRHVSVTVGRAPFCPVIRF